MHVHAHAMHITTEVPSVLTAADTMHLPQCKLCGGRALLAAHHDAMMSACKDTALPNAAAPTTARASEHARIHANQNLPCRSCGQEV